MGDKPTDPDHPTDPGTCDNPSEPDMPSDPEEDDDDLYASLYRTVVCFPPNLKFPDYQPSVDMDEENDDHEEEDEYEYRLRTLLECIHKKRLNIFESKEPDEPEEDKITEGGEESESESEEENESDSEYEDKPLFNSSPSHNTLLQNYVHVKDPIIEVEEWRGCPICGDLNKSHGVWRCPWLKKMPQDKRPGPHYDTYCIECGMLGQNCCSKGVGLVLKSCGLCWFSGHWSKTCPYYKPKNPHDKSF